MKKQRWFNYRPLCLIFAFLLLGSIFSFYIINHVVLTIAISILVLAIFIFIAIKRKNIKLILVPLIAFIVGIGAYYLTIYNFNKGVSFVPNKVEARVSIVGKTTDSYLYLKADSVELDGKEINDNIILYIYDYESLYEGIEIGSHLTIKPINFYHSNIFYNEIPNAKLIFDDIKYIVTAKIEDVEVGNTDKTFAEKIRSEIKNNLAEGLTNDNVEIAYSSLFGEKEMLNENHKLSFRLSGVAHLLAVSGLHVGIITGILYTILNFFKIKKVARLAIVTPILLFYMYICNFATSILRASIMAIVLMLSDVFGEEYDIFCSISLAGIIIYAINPLCVFDVSFLMSFSCVLGIAMLYKPIYKALIKGKFNKKVASSIALSLSSTLSLMLIMAFFFRTLNVISIVANLIIIPIFTIGFTITFVCAFASLIIPHLCYVLYPVNYIFDIISVIAKIFGSLSFSNFNTARFNYIALVVYFMLLLFIGRFCTAKYQHRVIIILPMVALIFCCLV